MKKLLTLLGLSAFAAGSVSQAMLLLSEDFSLYADGTDVAFAGTVGANTWEKSKGTTVAGYNVFTNVSGGALDIWSNFATIGGASQEVVGIFNANTGVAGLFDMAYGFDLTMTALPTGSDYIIGGGGYDSADTGGLLNSGLRGRVSIDPTGAIGIGWAGTDADFTGQPVLALDTTYRVEVEIVTHSTDPLAFLGVGTYANLYLNGTLVDTVVGALDYAFGGVNLNKAATDKGWAATMDNLLIGNTLADIQVPEPSALAGLLGLFAMGFVVRRRR